VQRPLKRTTAILSALVLGAAGVTYWKASPGPLEEKPPVARARAAFSPPLVGHTPLPAPSVEVARPQQISLAIERALVAADPAMQETAFEVLLPELLATDGAAAAALLDRPREPGMRHRLREHISRGWVIRDREAAVRWMQGLPGEDKQVAALIAVRALAAHSHAQALELADEFGVGRDDGTRAYLLQIWAAEDPEAARRWLVLRGESVSAF